MVNFREPKCATRLFNNDFSDFLSQVFNETIIQHEKESLVDWCFCSVNSVSLKFRSRGYHKSSTIVRLFFIRGGFKSHYDLVVIYFINNSGGHGRLGLQGKVKRP